ncbi:MAG: hypothetical protein V7603_3707 [Micromonosporaceae bacterium]
MTMNPTASGVPLDLSAATFAVTWRAAGTHQALALFDDGVWFWTLASPDAAWAALAGTFRGEAGGGERAALLDIAARVAAAAIPAIPESAAGGLALVLAAGGRTIRVDAGSAAAAEVTRAVSPLLATARPVSAVQVRAARACSA